MIQPCLYCQEGTESLSTGRFEHHGKWTVYCIPLCDGCLEAIVGGALDVTEFAEEMMRQLLEDYGTTEVQ